MVTIVNRTFFIHSINTIKMKNSIILFIATVFLTGTILTGCQTSDDKVSREQKDVTEAKEDLKEEQAEVQKAANEARWKAYKDEAQVKFDANDAVIADTKTKWKSAGRKMDNVAQQQIDALEKQNKDLRQRLNGYNANTQAEWDAFQREFNRDMDEMGTALNNLTVNNKN